MFGVFCRPRTAFEKGCISVKQKIVIKDITGTNEATEHANRGLKEFVVDHTSKIETV